MELKILEHLDDPDTRRYFGIPPKRIPKDRMKELEGRLTFPRHGIVWNPRAQTLYSFHEDHHTVMKPVVLDIDLEGLCIFNLYEHPYEEAKYWNNGSVLVSPKWSAWATDYFVHRYKDAKLSEPEMGR